MTTTRLLSLALLGAVVACDQPTSPAPDTAPAPTFSAGANPNTTWSDDPVVLDFESITPAEGGPLDRVGPTYREDGYTLAVDGDGVFGTYGSASPSYAGSTGLFLNSVLNLQVVLTSDDGTLFSAESIDLAPAITWAPRGVVTFVGTRADGSTVTQTHTTSGRVFSTFQLEGFTSLVELRWTQDFTQRELHQFDDIVLRDAQAQSKGDCVEGGWELYGFRNQGQCLRILEAGSRPGDRG